MSSNVRPRGWIMYLYYNVIHDSMRSTKVPVRVTLSPEVIDYFNVHDELKMSVVTDNLLKEYVKSNSVKGKNAGLM